MIIFGSREHNKWDEVFSNFVPCEIEMDGIVYPTTEHAYQAHKTRDKNLRKQIAKLETPGKAKRAGRKAITLRNDWQKVKFDVMLECLRLKFAQEPFRSDILSTGEEDIAEDASQWDDAEWGLGKSGNGKNLLGKALMQVREEVNDK